MKIDNNTTVVHGNVDAEAISLGIDLSGMNHVMSILSNLYSDAPLAVLREYSTNARDSHIQANNPAPIEVISPTPFMPQLTIIDHGVGMSKDDILDTYSRYGSSTKRADNTQVGAFGIGSKSAFTIASQFTVTGSKNGIQNVVLFSLTEDNTPILQVLQSSPAEDRGVKVGIPIQNVTEMRQTIEKFFYTWRPGTVLVDGEEPTNLWTDKKVLDLGQGVYVRRADKAVLRYQRSTTFNLLMGSIAYPVEDVYTIGKKLERGATVYAEVGVGSVDIAPSREALKDTDKTKAMIKDVERQFPGLLATKEMIALGAATPSPAVARLCRKWGNIKEVDSDQAWLNHTLSWGLCRITHVEAPHLLLGGMVLRPELLHQYLVITGVDTPRKASLVRKRADKWNKDRDSRNLSTHTVVVSPYESGSECGWFVYGPTGPIPTKPFKEFKAEAADLFRPKTSNRGYPATQPVYTYKIGQQPRECAPLKTVQDLTVGRKVVLTGYSLLDFLDDSYIQIKVEGRQSMEVARKRFPTTIQQHDLVAQEKRRKVNALSVYDKECLALQDAIGGRVRTLFAQLDEAVLTNSRLRDLVVRYKHGNALPHDLRNLPIEEVTANAAKSDIKWVRDRWPLLEHVSLPYEDLAQKEIIKAVEVYVNNA